MIVETIVFYDRPVDSKNRCDPNTFNNQTQDYHALDVLDEFRPYVNYFTLVFVILVSPFLIITPFWIPKLRTLCRQVIAMVVLSDLINTISAVVWSVNKSGWEMSKNSTNAVCATTTFIENTSFAWSLCWSFILLCCVLLNLHITSVNKQKLFYILNLVAWPSGAIITFTLYARPDLFPVTYNTSYIFSAGCQPKYWFEISDDGQKCLLSKEALFVLVPFYATFTFIIVASQIVFGFILYHAYIQYKRMATLAEKTKNQSEENSSYEIAAKFSYAVLKNSIPFSITAIIYVIIYIPINLKQFFVAYNGPIHGKPALQFFLTLWFLCAGNFTTLMNLIFYGLLSKVLRQEVVGRVRSKFSRVSLKVQRIRSVSDDSTHSTTVSVRQSVNERHFDLDNTFNSTPSEDASCMVAFFDEEDERLSSARN